MSGIGYPDGSDDDATLTTLDAVSIENFSSTVTIDDLAIEGYDADSDSGGHWIAEDGGRMDFNGVDVTGAATREVVDADCDDDICGGYFQIGSTSHVAASGDVILKLSRNNNLDGSSYTGPALYVIGTFCTTGDLLWESIDIDGTPSRPMIEVVADHTAKFGVSSCAGSP